MNPFQVALTGDIMLGRLVDRLIIQNPDLPPGSVWGDVLPLLLKADCRLANLECVISKQGQAWDPDHKPFHFRTDPRAIQVLQTARIDCVTLANNHVLDFGPAALQDCLILLDQAGIRHVGAGPDLESALEPVLLELPEARLAIVALTDNEPRWEAKDQTPGINYVRSDEKGLVEPYRARTAMVLEQARRLASFVIVSAHVGPNWGKPSASIQALAHEVVDLGADLYWGHSNHTPQGIEWYREKPILYSTGDFVDDYAVSPLERNDLSFLFCLDVEGDQVRRIRLQPSAIDRCHVRQAKGADVKFLQETMRAKCADWGTAIDFHEGVGTVRSPSGPRGTASA